METFKLDGLKSLQSLRIGNYSFTKNKDCFDDDPLRSFHVANCSQLKSIDIGLYSFVDYSGQIEFKNLPLLESIKFGSIGSKSYNFYSGSFVIGGRIEVTILMF